MTSKNELDEAEGAFLPHCWKLYNDVYYRSLSNEESEAKWYCSRCGAIVRTNKRPETGGCVVSGA